MSIRMFATVLLIAFAFSLIPASAADNGSGPTKKELKALCDAVNNVCHAACERGGGVSATISESFCRDDCDRKMLQCHATIPLRQRLKGTTSDQTDGITLYRKE